MTDRVFPDEAQLIDRILTGDQTALSELYQQYGALVYSLAMRVIGNSVLAEEVTQDAFLKVWHQASTWDATKGKLVSWLLTITRYTAIDRLRKEQRRPSASAVSIDDMMGGVGTPSAVDDPMWSDGRLLRTLLAKLPPEQMQVIELAFYQGMTHTELAEHLQTPLGTVKTRVRLGLMKLRELWMEAGGETATRR